VPEQQLGSVVEPTDITSVAAEIDNWLSMTPSDKEAFAERASRYMREHLSMEAMVGKRLEIWDERLNRSRG
jgi:hypothetical protein